MDTTRLSSKGQIVLPKSVRDHHRWQPGTAFSIETTDDGVLLRPLAPMPATRLDDVAGCLRDVGPLPAGSVHSVADMNAAIAAELRARHDRGRY